MILFGVRLSREQPNLFSLLPRRLGMSSLTQKPGIKDRARRTPRSGKRSYLVGSQFQERTSDGKDRRTAGYRCRRAREDNGRGEGG